MPTVTVIQPTLTEEKTAKIRCAAYCRVSSDSEDQLNSFMAHRFFEDARKSDGHICGRMDQAKFVEVTSAASFSDDEGLPQVR